MVGKPTHQGKRADSEAFLSLFISASAGAGVLALAWTIYCGSDVRSLSLLRGGRLSSSLLAGECWLSVARDHKASSLLSHTTIVAFVPLPFPRPVNWIIYSQPTETLPRCVACGGHLCPIGAQQPRG